MAALDVPASRAEGLLAERWRGRLWVAVESGPAGCVVAGEVAAVEELVALSAAANEPAADEPAADELAPHGPAAGGESAAVTGSAAAGVGPGGPAVVAPTPEELVVFRGVRVRRIAVDYASHTPHMRVLKGELAAVLAQVRPGRAEVGFCSSVTGTVLDGPELTGGYWVDNLCRTVAFDAAVRVAARQVSRPVFVEVSPHPVLVNDVAEICRDAEVAAGVCGSLRRGEGGAARLLASLAHAWTQGAPVDWPAVLGDGPRPDRQPPTYAFQRTRHWLDADAASSRHPLLDQAVPLAADDGFLLTGRLSLTATPWLADHAVDGVVLLPGTAFAELALEAASRAGCDLVEDLTLEAPLTLPDTGSTQLQVTVGGPDEDGRRALHVHARRTDDDPWTRHAHGLLAAATPDGTPEERLSWPPREGTELDPDDLYERLAARGYGYGPAFRGLRAAWRVPGGPAYAEVALPEAARGDAARFALHPALLDAALHLVVAGADDAGDTLLLPFSWSGVRVAALGADTLRVRLDERGEDRVSLALFDGTGEWIAGVETLALRRTARNASRPATATPAYAIEWTEAARTPVDGQRWAVVGFDALADEIEAELSAAGVPAPRYYDLASLADMSAGEVPGLVLAPLQGDPEDLPYAAHDGLGQALDLVQGWLGDERFAGSRLVLVTRPGDLAGSAVRGLARSAQSEQPGRFVLAELPAGFPGWDRLAAAVAAGETQLAATDGTLLAPRLARREPVPAVSPDLPGTVLVTGGTGGLGALVARHLVEQHGARDLLLLSRRGLEAPGALDLVAELEELGAHVTVTACDVSDRTALRAIIESAPRLTGVVHAAGILDDALVQDLTPDRVTAVLAPKADAAWHLHELTRDHPLSMFVLFSSVAGVLGNAGQGNYAAANAFLDALAEHRHDLGLPAVSVAWGLWEAASGMTGTLDQTDLARLARAGIAPLSVQQGLALFDTALTTTDPLLVAARWDNAGLRARAEHGDLPPVLKSLVRAPRRTATPGQASAAPAAGPGLAERLAAMAEPDGRAHLVQLVRGHVAAVLAHSGPDSVEVDRAFNELGFDSLTAVELRNRLGADTGLRLPATLVFDHPTVTSLAEYLFHSLAPDGPSPEDALRAAVDQAEAALLAANGQTDAVRRRLAAILQSALARIGTTTAAASATDRPGANGAAEEIVSASDEEIFALIDNRSMTSPLRTLEGPGHGQ
ncbi:SDR family NAD(P)-dependent oxidoreductase [Nonomuraea sp. NPDC050783]|uniref:SDR family NAD(P)-dependent oxidoreductase n=1 Tax=Nonomuraea sp. NPDC050783 TaxID=3154634 RepID=UPI00346727A5